VGCAEYAELLWAGHLQGHSHLTLNAGLRYELPFPQRKIHKFARFV